MADNPTIHNKERTNKKTKTLKVNKTSSFILNDLLKEKRMSIKDKHKTENITKTQENPKKNNLEENLIKEDGMIKGFLFGLMEKEDKDDFVDVNFNKNQNLKIKNLSKLPQPKKRRFGQIIPDSITVNNDLNTVGETISSSNKNNLRKSKDSKIKLCVEEEENSYSLQLGKKNKKFKTALFISAIKGGNKINLNDSLQKEKELEGQSIVKSTANDNLNKLIGEDLQSKQNKKVINNESQNITKSSRSFITEESLIKKENVLTERSNIDKQNESSKIQDKLNDHTNKSIANEEKEEEIFVVEDRLKTKLKINNYFKEESNMNTVLEQKNIDFNTKGRDLKSFKNVYDSLSDYEEDEANPQFLDKYEDDVFIIHPESQLKALWDYVMLFSVIYCFFVYPYRIAFRHISILWNFYFMVDMVVDIIFIIDFIFLFLTPFYDKNDNLIFDKWMIFKNNLLNITNFSSDLISSIPIAIFNILQIGYMQNILVILRLNRIMKIFKVNKHSSVIAHQNSFYLFFFNDTYISRTFRYAIMFIFIIHVCSCIWIYIGLLEPNEIQIFGFKGLPEFNDTWIHRVLIMSNRQYVAKPYDEFDIYICSLYFTLTTIYTIGYGDIVSKNILERLYNNLFMLVGVMLYSFAVSNLSTAFAQKDKATKKYYKKLKILNEIKTECRLPDDTFEKIKKNLTYNFKQNYSGFYDEKYKFLKSLPKVLKNEITVIIYKKQLKNLLFFQEKYMNKNFDFILSTLPHMLSTRMIRGELIFKMGDMVEELYIVKKGCLSAFVVESFVPLEIAQIPKNYNFGEILMYSNESTPFSLKVASSYCEMMVLKKEKFTKLKIKYPGIVSNILKEGWEFYCFLIERRNFILENISQMESSKLTDPMEIKKQVKLLKLKFYDGNRGNKLMNSNFLKSSQDFEKDETTNSLIEEKNANTDSSNHKLDTNIITHTKINNEEQLFFDDKIRNYKLDKQMEKIEKNLDDELSLIKEIKRRNSRGKTIIIKEENKKETVKDLINSSKLLSKINYNQSEEKLKSFFPNEIKLLEDRPSNFIRHSESAKSPSFPTKSSSSNKNSILSPSLKINLNYFHIENNINEHYLMMDHNIDLNRGENSKNKLIDLVSNNKILKKKIVRQETNVRNMFKRDLSSQKSLNDHQSVQNTNPLYTATQTLSPTQYIKYPLSTHSHNSLASSPKIFKTNSLKTKPSPNSDCKTLDKQIQAIDEILKIFKSACV